MATLRVIDPGMFTTVQDLGRPGHCAYGVPASGAADALSLAVGNRLVGNPDHGAGLECTLRGPSVTLDRDAWVCLVGASCPDARITGPEAERPLPWCEPTKARAGDVIHAGNTCEGSRAWLCVEGGIGGTRVLGSRSTLTSASLGGNDGRALRAGDVLPLLHRPRRDDAADLRRAPGALRGWLRARLFRTALRVVPSLHVDRFPPGVFERLCAGAYTVDPQSNRVGIRLCGPALPLPENAGVLDSEPTVTGGVQIPGNARPIVLGVDRPTTGGYPLLASVIQADLPSLAMLGPGDTVRFDPVTLEEARALAARQRRELEGMLPAARTGGDP